LITKKSSAMKKAICNIQDALAFQLQGLFYTEKKASEEFNTCQHQITSKNLKSEVEKYIDSANSKVLKLERAFNYLMQETMTRKNEIVDKMIDETHHMLAHASSPYLKDILMISCIQNINAYKISSYKTAYLFAVELELDTVSDLLQQILEWELAASKALAGLAIEEFNKAPATVKAK
jgi:ferritin-like metal-binding protein YciE